MLELAADEVYRLHYQAGQAWAAARRRRRQGHRRSGARAAALATLARALAWGGESERGEAGALRGARDSSTR